MLNLTWHRDNHSDKQTYSTFQQAYTDDIAHTTTISVKKPRKSAATPIVAPVTLQSNVIAGNPQSHTHPLQSISAEKLQ